MMKNEFLLQVAINATRYYNGSEFKQRRLVDGLEKYVTQFYGVDYPTEDYICLLAEAKGEDAYSEVEQEVWSKWYRAVETAVEEALKLLEDLKER